MGDMHVGVINKHASWSSTSNTTYIDANSVSSGNMTESVKVKDQTVYMTKEGAEEYNRLMDSDGYRATANDDPKWYNILTATPDQKFVGTP